MVVPRQYPYELWQYSAGGDSVQDGDGNWIENPGTWSKVGMCRDEVNNKGAQISATDGTFYVFDFLIQLPKSTPFIHVGTEIEVRFGSTVRAKGTVKRYDPAQMHSRIWI